MTLAALIIADDEGFAGSAIRGDASLFGMPLIEYQARLAVKAGVTHLILCSALVPASLVAAVDRLRADQLNVALVRTAREAADSVHPEEAVLIFAPHCLPSAALVEKLANRQATSIVVSPLKAMSPSRELIDAEHDWAGLALIEGMLVRQTASMLGDWALGSTLLRIAVQNGAERLLVDEGQGLTVATVINRSDSKYAEKQLVTRENRNLSGRISGWMAQAFAASTVSPKLLAMVPLIWLTMALLLAVGGWLKAGLILFALAMIPATGMQRLIEASLHPSKPIRLFWVIQPWVGRAILLISAWLMTSAGFGWGCLVLGGWLVWSLWDGDQGDHPFSANEGSAALLVLGGILACMPAVGYMAAIAHSLFQRVAAKLRPALTKLR